MNHSQFVVLADAIRAVRPDWQQPGIIAQLKLLAETWKGTDGAFSLHAMAVAANPNAQTPGALNAAPPKQEPRYDDRWSEPTCHICSQSRSRCLSRRDWEVRRGIPDPHDFETREEAEQRTTKAGHDA